MSNQQKIFVIIFFFSWLIFLWLIKSFIPTLTIAILIALFFNPVYKKFLYVTKGNYRISSILTILFVFLFFLVPIPILGSIIYWQAGIVAEDLKNLNIEIGNFSNLLNSFVENINAFLRNYSIEYELTSVELINNLNTVLQNLGLAIINLIRNFGASLPEIITHLIILIIFLDFIFINQYKIQKYIMLLTPLPVDITKLYLQNAFSISKSMVKGTFVIAFVQGLLSVFALYLAGVPYLVVWFFVLTLAAIIPFIGTGIILVPLSIVLLLIGNVIGAFIVLIFQFLVISNIDNILRPKLVDKNLNIPEPIILLGVVAGLFVFGPMGLIFGPVITVFVTTTFEIFTKYYAFKIKSILTRDF